MSERDRHHRPARASVVAGTITVVGLLLAVFVDMRLFVLAGVGAFGPGLLREFGLLRDQDEFRRQSAYRAGYYAYLAGGFAAVLLVATIGAGTVEIGDTAQSAATVLVVLWLVWLFAAGFEFWGVRRAVVTTLLVYGVFWLLFNIFGNLRDPVAMFMQCLTAAPFLVLAWMTRIWPRVTGLLLLVAGIAAVVLFDLGRAVTRGDPGAALIFVAFALPLLASGVALLRGGVER